MRDAVQSPRRDGVGVPRGGRGLRPVCALFLAALLAALWGCGKPPAPAPFPGHPEDLVVYTVQPGETLYDLAERHYGERSLAWSLAVVNELPDPALIEAGTTVFIPKDARVLQSMAGQRREAKRPYNRGTYLLEIGRDEEAIRQLEKALSVAPEVVAPRYHLGVAYLRAGRTEEAVRELEDVAARRPLDRDFRYALGCAYLEQGRLKEARREFSQATEFDESFAPARFGTALAIQLSGKTKEAIEAWRAYLDRDPEGEWAERARQYLTDLYDGD